MKGGDETGAAPDVAASEPPVETPESTPPPAVPAQVDVPIETTPPGAYVKIGNLRYGPTPTSIRLAPGEVVTMHIVLDGYEPAEKRVSVADDSAPVKLALTPVEVEEPDSEPPAATREKRHEKRTRRAVPVFLVAWLASGEPFYGETEDVVAVGPGKGLVFKRLTRYGRPGSAPGCSGTVG